MRAASRWTTELQADTYTTGRANEGPPCPWTRAATSSSPGTACTRTTPTPASSRSASVLLPCWTSTATVTIDPLSDGLLVLRDEFGFAGEVLVNGVVNLGGCLRCTAPEIEAYLDTLK